MFSYACFFHSDPKTVFGFDAGEYAIHLDDIRCVGNEASLLECTFDTSERHNCFLFDYQHEDPGVSCGNSIFNLLSHSILLI